MGLGDPQVLLACLDHLALEDLVLLGHRDPQGHQDLQLSWEQVSTVCGTLIYAAPAVMLKVTTYGWHVRATPSDRGLFPGWSFPSFCGKIEMIHMP